MFCHKINYKHFIIFFINYSSLYHCILKKRTKYWSRTLSTRFFDILASALSKPTQEWIKECIFVSRRVAYISLENLYTNIHSLLYVQGLQGLNDYLWILFYPSIISENITIWGIKMSGPSLVKRNNSLVTKWTHEYHYEISIVQYASYEMSTVFIYLFAKLPPVLHMSDPMTSTWPLSTAANTQHAHTHPHMHAPLSIRHTCMDNTGVVFYLLTS